MSEIQISNEGSEAANSAAISSAEPLVTVALDMTEVTSDDQVVREQEQAPRASKGHQGQTGPKQRVAKIAPSGMPLSMAGMPRALSCPLRMSRSTNAI